MTFRPGARLAAAVLALVVLAPEPASAQFGQMGGGFGGPQGPPPTAQTQQGPSKKKKDPNEPETHAAPGSPDELAPLPQSEVTLPKDPLAMSPDVKARIGSDAASGLDQGVSGPMSRSWYGLYYQEQQGSQYRLRTVFPIWLERTLPGDRASLFTPLYYNRRSVEHDADIFFPIVWSLRDGDTHTRVIGPAAWYRSPTRSDNWFAPLIFQGASTGSGYFHIPPLLTFTQHDRTSGLNIVGPAYCSWTGGSTCSLRSASHIDLGIAPFYFYGRDTNSEYEVVPPLLHYYSYSEIGESSLNVWGPLIWKQSQGVKAFDILPLFFHVWGTDEDHYTLFPLFHYGYHGEENLLITPLFLAAHGAKGESTFVTWGYARYRGRTELDMYTPLYWEFRDPDIGREMKLLAPFLYSNNSARDRDLMFFPFWARFERMGIRTTTWVTPLVQHTDSLDGWQTNIYPLAFFGRSGESSHTIVAPVLWDFASPKQRLTVVAPLYVRIAEGDSVTQVALNTYYHERKYREGTSWEFHFFPLFSYGEIPDGHWWKVLYGLAGYSRKGPSTKIYAAWIPFQISGSDSF